MAQHDESHDAALAQALAEEEITLATASDIELARRLAERPAFVYQEIALEQGQQNVARTQAQPASTDDAQKPAEEARQEAPSLPRCLICDGAEHLSRIQDVGHLCFSCLSHNSGAELEGLAFG
jgi:hypothetical protein